MTKCNIIIVFNLFVYIVFLIFKFKSLKIKITAHWFVDLESAEDLKV